MRESELHELLNAVADQDSFLRFANALRDDRERGAAPDAFGRGPRGWENHTIEDFLEAAIAWATTTSFGETQDGTNRSPWWQFASFLYCGKIYE